MTAQVSCCLQVEDRFEHCHDSLLTVVGLALGAAGWLILVSWFPMPGCGWGFVFVPVPGMWACVISSW